MSNSRPIPASFGVVPPGRLCRWHGITLVEILVALAIASILLVAVIGTFTILLSLSKSSEVQLEALSSARAALETMSREVKEVATAPHPVYVVGEDHPTRFGDGKDNDRDGKPDEEQADGRDNDGDWDKKENHAAIGGLVERPHQPSEQADLGENGVDEDCVFNHDRLSFRVAAPARSDHLYEDITYELLTPPREFDGQSYVLTRTTTYTLSDGSGEVKSATAPIAYGVLSFNCLYWDPNAQPQGQYWLTQWDSRTSTGPFRAPASVQVELVVHADKKAIEEYKEGSAVDTLSLRTLVNIESVIQSGAFPRDP
jgi:type II secretory pathway pseudopilin PulG